MDLQNFSSIIELFATFSLAYIVIDEFAPNPFIATITSKILRRYKVVNQIRKDLATQIVGAENSINELIQRENQLLKELEVARTKLKSTATRFENSFKEIDTKIQGTYTTKVFSHLNCFVFLYCLVLLFFGGVYSSSDWVRADSVAGPKFIARLDSALAILLFASYVYGISGWVRDTTKEVEDPNTFQKISAMFNGYGVSTVWCFGGTLIATGSFFFRFNFYPKDMYWPHTSLVLLAIFFPFINFGVYVRKAARRARQHEPEITKLAKDYQKDYEAEILSAQDYMKAGAVIEKEGIKIMREKSEGEKKADSEPKA